MFREPWTSKDRSASRLSAWSRWIVPLSLFAIVILSWAVTVWLEAGPTGPWTFDSLTTLFTGLAVVGAGWAIYLQIEKDRKEKVFTRFIHLLDAWRAIAASIEIDGKTGVKAFLLLERRLLIAHIGANEHDPNRTALEPNAVALAFDRFYESVGADVGHIFRLHYQIVRLMHESSVLDESERRELIHVFRNMLSDPELHILLYLGLSNFVDKGFRRLIDDYELLDGFTFKPFVKMENGKQVYIRSRIAEIKHYPKTRQKWDRWHRETRPDFTAAEALHHRELEPLKAVT